MDFMFQWQEQYLTVSTPLSYLRITNNNSEQYEDQNYIYEDDDDYDDEWSDNSEWSDDDDENKTVGLYSPCISS